MVLQDYKIDGDYICISKEELEKWIGVIRDKFCCSGWSFVISASNFALFSGDLIEEKRIKE